MPCSSARYSSFLFIHKCTRIPFRFMCDTVIVWLKNSQAVKCQGLDLDSLLPDQEMLMKIMVHPLQIQVLKAGLMNTFGVYIPVCVCSRGAYQARLQWWQWAYHLGNQCSRAVKDSQSCSISPFSGMSVRDPQQHVGEKWSSDQGTGYDLRAVTLLQLNDRPRHLSAPG